MQIQITIVNMKLVKTLIKQTWEITKAIYAIVGILMILPIAVIVALTEILYTNAKTYIQAKTR